MATTGHDGSTRYAWSAHPMREQPGRAVMGCVWVAAFALLAHATTGGIGWAFFSVIVLTGALHRFFFPSRYEMDEEGITARSLLRTQRMRWSEVRRFLHDENGGYLSAHARASRLDGYRGLHLLFGRDRAVVIERIQSRLAVLTMDGMINGGSHSASPAVNTRAQRQTA